jgi:hypothetical protein
MRTARDRSVVKARREGEAWATARQTRERAVAFARDNFDWADERDAFLAGFDERAGRSSHVSNAEARRIHALLGRR